MAAPKQRMFVLPPIRDDFIFAVLRRTYDTETNDTVEFVRTKLHPIASPPSVGEERLWRPTAARYEVLLPRGMPDLLGNPKLLAETYEDQAVAHQRDLAVVIKLVLPPNTEMHEGWELARRFTREVLVIEHRLPTIMILHAPSLSGVRNANPRHVHLITLARRWEAGFSEFATIARDAAHEPLSKRWGEMKTNEEYRPNA